MANFDEMAKAAREKSQSVVDAKAEAERVKKEADQNRLEQADIFLRENVFPILVEAQGEFQKNDVVLEFSQTKSWRLINRSSGNTLEIRAIGFSCTSPSDDGNTGRKLEGEQYAFEHDGTTLSWKRFAAIDNGQKFTGGTIDSFVTPVVGKALDSYFEKLRSSIK